jgi:Zn-dependent peptidase ImmA (M78 family)
LSPVSTVCNKLRQRINIAHELGHLYLLARYYAETGKENDPNLERTTEPLSSIFGLFTISDKNHFYENLASSGRNHTEWQSILEDFKNLNYYSSIRDTAP